MPNSYRNDHPAYNLPDSYRKTPESNNYKLLEIEADEQRKQADTLQNLDDVLDLNNAGGKTLDMEGQMVGQARGLANDAQYRYLIRSKIMQNLSGGDYNSVLRAITITFNCEPSEVQIVDSDKPCTVDVILLPLAVIVHAGFTARQAISMLQRLLPVCVSIDSYLFEGTFEFADAEGVQDPQTGFSDKEDGSIGGYFGITQGQEDEPVLPI